MDLPVTLVIKAPNQRVEDQTVDCMLGWTVKKLKQHLTDVYPNKPNETSQRLIYSGKLLADHLTLKEVLRQFDDDSNKHTVHLVCSSSPHAENRSYFSKDSVQSQTHSRQSSSSSTNSQHSTSSATESEGLRYRGIRNPSPSSPNMSQSVPVNPYVFSQSSGMPQQPQMPAGFMPDPAMMFGGNGGMAYTPEQYMWMQQMYAQYMTQYMQYYQQGIYQMPPGATPLSQTPAGQAQAPPQNPAAANNGDQDANDDFIDDEEFGQRDWLDYLYTFSRFMVLIGIVYFYSSIYRFFAVGGVFLLIYALHMGWFHRRNNQRQQQNEQPREPEPQQEQQQQQQHNDEGDNSDEPNPTEPPAPPQEPPAPGMVQLTWTFVSTFFTSLFPSPPPAVNVN